jgi:hypothetical protein
MDDRNVARTGAQDVALDARGNFQNGVANQLAAAPRAQSAYQNAATQGSANMQGRMDTRNDARTGAQQKVLAARPGLVGGAVTKIGRAHV